MKVLLSCAKSLRCWVILLSLEREAGAVLSADLARTQAQLEMAENQNSLLTAQLSSLTAQLTDEKTKTPPLKIPWQLNGSATQS